MFENSVVDEVFGTLPIQKNLSSQIHIIDGKEYSYNNNKRYQIYYKNKHLFGISEEKFNKSSDSELFSLVKNEEAYN